MFKRVNAVRGAVGVPEDTPKLIEESVKSLIDTLLDYNSLKIRDIISIQFTQTHDLTSRNPAGALRKYGFRDIPLFCSAEPRYAEETEKIIRVLITYRGRRGRAPKPVYLGRAKNLRKDLYPGAFNR
ncbi:MAG: chorismate mutase [Spirochaetia bacterium]